MEIKDARTIDAGALYERRKQAVMLFQKGMSRVEIAPVVGVCRQKVGEWIKGWQSGGLAALKVKGSGRKLLRHEEGELQRLIADKCPDQLKLPFALWDRQAVRQLIRAETAQYAA